MLLVLLAALLSFVAANPIILGSSNSGGNNSTDFCSSKFTSFLGKDFRGLSDTTWYGFAFETPTDSAAVHDVFSNIACSAVSYPKLSPNEAENPTYYAIQKQMIVAADTTSDDVYAHSSGGDYTPVDVSTIGYFGYNPPREPTEEEIQPLQPTTSAAKCIDGGPCYNAIVYGQLAAAAEATLPILHEMSYQTGEEGEPMPLYIKTKIIDTDYSNYLALYVCSHSNGRSKETISVFSGQPASTLAAAIAGGNDDDGTLKRKRRQTAVARRTFTNMLTTVYAQFPDKAEHLRRISSRACPVQSRPLV